MTTGRINQVTVVVLFLLEKQKTNSTPHNAELAAVCGCADVLFVSKYKKAKLQRFVFCAGDYTPTQRVRVVCAPSLQRPFRITKETVWFSKYETCLCVCDLFTHFTNTPNLA